MTRGRVPRVVRRRKENSMRSKAVQGCPHSPAADSKVRTTDEDDRTKDSPELKAGDV